MKSLKIALISILLLILGSMSYICYEASRTRQMLEMKADGHYFHFSIDDVQELTKRLSDTDKESVFQDSIMRIFKQWHDKYGIVMSLFVQGDFCINSKYAEELIANSNWLKFGYHGEGNGRRNAWKLFKQIRDSIHSEDIIDWIPRLDYYHGTYLQCKYLQLFGCKGFLTCDDWSYNAANRGSNYYLNNDQSVIFDNTNRMIDSGNGLIFVKTDFRLEQIEQRWGKLASCLKYYEMSPQADELIVFSHEWNFTQHLELADSIFQWAKEHKYFFDFPMNRNHEPI